MANILKSCLIVINFLINLYIEFGFKKVKKLLMALENPKEYIPIDISYEFLKTNAKEFAKNFPNTEILKTFPIWYESKFPFSYYRRKL